MLASYINYFSRRDSVGVQSPASAFELMLVDCGSKPRPTDGDVAGASPRPTAKCSEPRPSIELFGLPRTSALANKRISLTTYHIYDKIILENLSHLYTFRIFLHL